MSDLTVSKKDGSVSVPSNKVENSPFINLNGFVRNIDQCPKSLTQDQWSLVLKEQKSEFLFRYSHFMFFGLSSSNSFERALEDIKSDECECEYYCDWGVIEILMRYFPLPHRDARLHVLSHILSLADMISKCVDAELLEPGSIGDPSVYFKSYVFQGSVFDGVVHAYQDRYQRLFSQIGS